MKAPDTDTQPLAPRGTCDARCSAGPRPALPPCRQQRRAYRARLAPTSHTPHVRGCPHQSQRLRGHAGSRVASSTLMVYLFSCACPATATRASRMVMMDFFFIVRFLFVITFPTTIHSIWVLLRLHSLEIDFLTVDIAFQFPPLAGNPALALVSEGEDVEALLGPYEA